MCTKISLISVFSYLSPTVQQKDVPQNTSLSTAAGVSSCSSTSLLSGDLQIPTVSADVAADIAKYTNKVSQNLLNLSNKKSNLMFELLQC